MRFTHSRGTVAVALLATSAICAPAWAQERSFNIPAQSLTSALRSFGLQSGQQISFRAEDVRGYLSHAVVGTYQPGEVLDILIGRSGPLVVTRTNSGVFAVRRASVARVPAATSLAATAVQTAAPGTVQPAAPTDAPAVEEIIVTAQKREENVQDTPISIVALGAGTLEKMGVNSLGDLFTAAVPSVRIAPLFGRPSGVSIGMRGLVPGDVSQISRDTTVGVYMDGVYLGRVSGLGLEIADIERMEVLRGPQGTLFGRNALGGAISIISRRPSGELEIDVKGGLNNFNGRSIATHVNLPEVHGLSLKFDGLLEHRDGVVKNPLKSSRDYGEINKAGARISALWKATDKLSILYAWDYSKEKPTSNYYYLFGSATPPASRPSFMKIDDGRTDVARIGVPVFQSPQKSEGHGLTAEWEVNDNLLVRSITGWRRLNSKQYDQDAGTLTGWGVGRRFGRISYAQVKQNQFSQELQLVGDVGEFQYVVGGFYFNERAQDTATIFSSGIINPGLNDITLFPSPQPDAGAAIPDRSSKVQAKSKALFGQLTWSPMALEGLHATLGARYTDDHKNGRLTVLAGADPNLAFVFNSSRIDPMANLAYHFNKDINAYVKWSRAYRAGGANSRSVDFRPFDEEVLTAWEFGTKVDLFDRRIRLNLAAYTSLLSDQQVDFGNPRTPSNSETRNAPEKRRIKGIELDLTIVPARGLTLSGNYVYTDAPPTPVVNPYTGRVEQVYSAFTPRHAAGFAVDYVFPPFSFGTLNAHVDGSTVGDAVVFNNQEQHTDKDFLINGRLALGGIKLAGGELELSLWGKNIFNKTFRMVELDLTGFGRNRYGIYNDPRTYGVEARVKF